MKIKFTSKYLLTLLLLIFVRNVNAQCVDIQTILVDACSATSPSNDEGFNEMVRFRVGPNPLNVANLSVNWPSNAWTGVIQNATTAAKVASINASIIAAGNCGQVLEPTGGVLPANSTVLLVTSQNFTINYNSFNSLTSTLYIIFQNNNSVTGGHFGNYNPTPGTRTLSISFGGTCSDTVTYERSNLVNIFGVSGGTLAEQDGAAVNFSPSGVPTYVNEGCTAPVPPFTVNATASPTSCVSPGSVVNLTGTAQGYQSLQWTSDSGGTFSAPIALNSNYNVPSTATGTITLTLTATNVCNVSISSSVTISIGTSLTPTVVSPITYCQNATASALTATPSAGGTLNWYGTNATGGTASSTAPTPSTTANGTTTYYVSQTIGACESPRVAIVVIVSNTPPSQAPQLFCDVANSTPTSVAFDFNNIGQTNFTYSYSIDGGTPVTGTHVSPSNFSVPGVAPGQTVTFSLTWNGVCGASLTASTTVPTFTQLGPYCAGQTIPNLPLTSLNGKTGTWSPAVVDNMNTGTYVFTPNPEQCASRTSMTIVVTSTPTLVITNPPAVCSPSTVDLTLASVTAGSSTGTLSYWTNAAGTTVLNNPNAVTSSGTYYIRLTNGSCSTIQPVVVTINPSSTLVITNPPAVCSPSTVDLTLASVTAGSSIGTLSYWTNAAGTTVLNNPNAVTSSGTYYIRLTNGSCSTIQPVVVTINPSSTLVITNPPAVCSPSTVDLTLASVTAGSSTGTLSYWTNAAGTTVLNNPNAVTSSGTYYIRLTNGSCSTIQPVVVTINPTPTLVITNPPAVCSPSTVDLTLASVTAGSSTGTLSYWTNAAGTTVLNNPNAVTSSGTYYIRLTNGSCSTIQPVVVTINATPTLVITNPPAVCSPSTVDLTLASVTAGSSTGTLSYWTNAAGTTVLNNPNAVTSSGTYYIRLTNGSCSTIQPVVVTINPTPTLVITNPPAVCSPSTVDLTLASVTAGSSTGTLSYWTNAAGTTVLNNPNAVTSSGTYYIRLTNGSCSTIQPVVVTIVPQVVVAIDIVENCGGNVITVTNPIGSNFAYSLDGAIPQSSPVFNNLTAGNHSIVAIETVGNCTSVPFNFFVNPFVNDVIVNPNPLPLQLCDPNNDGFSVFDLTSSIPSIIGTTSYTVTYHETVTDATIDGTIIPSPAGYPNINPWNQTIYIRVESLTTGCYEIVPLQLIVNPTPEATEPTDYHLCDYTGAVGYESFDLTSKIAEILGSINAATHTVTFYTDLTQAQLGTGNITNVTAYINGTIDQETLYVRVETNATGCYDIVTLDLIVDPLPNSTQPSYAQYSLCDYDQSKIGYEIFNLSSKEADILLGQTGMSVTFYPSLTDAQNDTNAITNLNYENAIIYVQTLGIRITNDATGCYVVSTMDIRVEPLPEPIPPTTPYTICDDNQDGFANFILSTLEADILGGEVYTITFHETLTNAQQGTNALSTTAYTNINPFVQILYVRAEDPVTGCFSVMPITLEVNPSPIAPIDLDDIEVCDTDSNNQSASTNVNLTVLTAAVLAQQPLPASSYTVTYYTSQPLAEDGDFPIINTSNYLASNLDTIWVRVENNATGCYNLGSFQVFVGIPLVVPTPQPINECDTLPNDQFAVFDLTVRQITALPGYTFQYYPSWTDAQNDTNQITNITSYTNVSPAVQTLGVRIISAQGCVGYTTLNIRVLPAPEPNTNPNVLPAVCEGATTPGQALVDLTQNEAYILNGDPNLTVEYYPTLADLENNTNQIINPASALVGDATLVDDPINLVQYVYIAVSGNNTIDYTGRRCYTVVPQGYVINPLPKVDIIGTSNVYQICESDPTGNDNIEVFDLTSQIPDLLEGNVTTPISTYSVAFYETATGSPITNPSAYTNTSNPQTIYVVITNTNAAATTMCPSLVGSFTLQVNPKPVFAIDITTDLNYETCDENDGINDGQTLHSGLPLSDYIDDILGTTQSPTDYTVTFHYNSQSDAEAGLNAIQDLATYQVQTGTYWVRIENNLTGCYITDSFAVIVEQLAEPNIVASTNIACVNFGETTVNNTLILDSQVTGNYTFEWYAGGNLIPGENGPTLTVTEVTEAQVEFSVIAISNTALQCTSDTTPDRTRFTVIRSGLASNLTYTVTNAFSDLQIITVTNDGYGIYHYSLDDGPILDNGGVFTNVPIGTHTVHVWDVRDPNGYSCGEVSIEGVQIIDYPHYFTPNGDGYHETWNIKGLENFADATKIYIFDRHGKLLKQISSDGDGWDGTYNGQLMPSTDYWFKVEYPEAGVMKEFKAHFSLKR